MKVSFKLYRPDDKQLSSFIKLLTDNGYRLTIERNNTKHMMVKVEVSESALSYYIKDDCVIRNCSNCKLNDGRVYTSYPANYYKCTVTGEVRTMSDGCDVDDKTYLEKLGQIVEGQEVDK